MTTPDNTPRERNREILWLLGGIGALLVLGLAVLLAVVLIYRAGPVRGHPTPTPAQTATPAARP